MDLQLQYCVIMGGEYSRVEKPGTITFSGGSMIVDDFVLVIGDNQTAGDLIREWLIDRLNQFSETIE